MSDVPVRELGGHAPAGPGGPSDRVVRPLRALVVAGHASPEPGARVALEHLQLPPLLDLELRLGEGTGALLAVPIVQAAARTLSEVATLDAVISE